MNVEVLVSSTGTVNLAIDTKDQTLAGIYKLKFFV